ncbi:MAG: hypothetical protein DI556_09845 [Rhodovulum sulfidophilum]|uniref:Uncharacterized protein n=1 Tax=Rhodovulum sulfidophilum TaxID=35806 RepID=A0A2W5Q4X6_RHOSU|nr:MAG: hypothetical protein DI556_09845 [Rhodovulum sulfidophilum]
MAIKQHFLPVHLADQIITVDASVNTPVAPSENGDYVAIAGIQASGVARIFEEADPDDPNEPAFYVRDEGKIDGDKDTATSSPLIQVGDVMTASVPSSTLSNAILGDISWRIFNPTDEAVDLATGSGLHWTAPNTLAGGGRRIAEFEYSWSDPYSDRVVGGTVQREIFGNSGAPNFTVDVSITGTGVLGTNGTIVAGTVTGSPTPSVAYQVMAGSVAQGALITALPATFPFSVAEVDYSVLATATNSEGEDTSRSNTIASTQPTVSVPTWNAAWWDFEELQTGTAGRIQVNIKGSPTFDSNYDYYIYTSGQSTATIVDVRKNGALFTATGAFIRGAKAEGTTVIPRIVAIRKGVADDAATGLHVLATTDPAYVITGILATGDITSSVAASLPAPLPALLADSLTELATLDRAMWNTASAGSTKPHTKHCLPTVALGAYYGNADAITKCIAQCKYYFEGTTNTSYGTYTAKGQANFDNRDPFYDWQYSAQYDMMILGFFAICLHTPAVRDALPANIVRAMHAGFEFVYATGFYIIGRKTAAEVDEPGVYSPRGRTGASVDRPAEPNISAGNIFLWSIAKMYFNSRSGREYLVSRGYANLAAFHANWTYDTFSAYLSSNPMRVGGVATGRRLCQGLWESVNFADLGFSGGKHSSARALKWSDINKSWLFAAGASFISSVSAHPRDDTSGMCIRYLMRCFGKEIGNPVGTAAGTDGDPYGGIYGLERSGSNGSLGNAGGWNGVGEIPVPPTFPGGPRVCHRGLPWFVGFAPGASGITGATLRTTTVNWSCGNGASGLPKAAGITGYNADNKLGIPWHRGVQADSHNENWAISGGVFTDRRGCPVNNTYPFPFLGETGIISEGFTLDAGTIRAHNVSGQQGQRCSANYMRETLSCVLGLLMAEAVISQGPNNLAKNPSMAAGWSSTDARWAKENANSAHGFRSASVYRYGYVAASTGDSPALISTKTDANIVVAGQKNLFSLQIRPTAGSVTMKVYCRWLNSSDVAIGSDVLVFSGSKASGKTHDVEKILLAPANAVSHLWVIVVDRATQAADVLVGGPNLRWEPDPQIDWSAGAAAELAVRARRGILWFRAALLNGWKDMCKMGYGYAQKQATNQSQRGSIGDNGTRSWASSRNGSRYVTLFGFMINQIIPYWRSHIEDYPAYGAGYTSYDWECPVTDTANSGIVAK